MDLFDSPLNLAHQQSRKADKFLKNARFDEAIECHRKATEYLTKAMAATTIQQALESLSLQRENHIRQQAIIREKQRRTLQANRVTSEAAEPTSKQSADPTGLDLNLPPEDSSKVTISRTLQESDSLLQFLNNRTAGCTDTYNVQPKAKADTARKPPRDDKDVIEQLRIHNDALRSHIVQFLKDQEEQHRQIEYYQRELDYARKESRDLKDRLSKVERPTVCGSPGQTHGTMETFYSMPMALNLDKMPSLDLPPLEMPKFDFDSLKANPEDDPGPSL